MTSIEELHNILKTYDVMHEQRKQNIEIAELLLDIETAIKKTKLKEIEKKIIKRYFFEDMTCQQISDEINKSVKKVQKILRNALSKIAEELK